MKKLILIILTIILITGCKKQNIEKMYLEDKYYNESEYMEVTARDIKKLNQETYLVFTYNNYCNLKIPCDTIFKKVMDKYNITILSLPFEEMKRTFIYDKVKYAPSVVIVKQNKVISYLDAEKNEDYNKYQNENEFEKWLSKYIYLNRSA